MRIFLHEISDEDTDLHFTAQDPWIYERVRELDEESPESSRSLRPAKLSAPVRMSDKRPDPKTPISTDRSIEADFNLRRVDEVVIITGDLTAPVRLLCSRCASPFFTELNTHFQLLFTKDAELAGVKSGRDNGGFQRESGRARHVHDDDERNVDICHLTTEYIDLTDIVTEQLQLTLPFQPLCKPDCKGICTRCGADLNKGRCACSKITDSKPFSVLKDIKTKTKAGS